MNFISLFSEKCSVEEFVPTMRKIYYKMFKVETIKTLPPKYTKAVKRLVRFLGLDFEQKE